jgi:hypothetical protein
VHKVLAGEHLLVRETCRLVAEDERDRTVDLMRARGSGAHVEHLRRPFAAAGG